MLLKLLLKFKQSVRFLQNINSNKSDNICVKCKIPSISPWSPLEVPLKDSFRDHKDNENMAVVKTNKTGANPREPIIQTLYLTG